MQNLKCHFCENTNTFICYCGKPICEYCFGFSLSKHQKKTNCCNKMSCSDIKYFNCEQCQKEYCSRCILKINNQIYCKNCIANIKNLSIFKYCDICNKWFSFESNDKCDVCSINHCYDCSQKCLYHCPHCNETICYQREHYRLNNYVEECGKCHKKYCKNCHKKPRTDFLECIMCGIEYCDECLFEMKYCLSCEGYHCLNCIGTNFEECQSEGCENIIPEKCLNDDIDAGCKIDYYIDKRICYNCSSEFYLCNYCKNIHKTKINGRIKYLCSNCCY